MPRISKEHKQLYKSKIRSFLAQNPQISQRELQLRLEQDGTKLDRKYLGSLLKGIYAERIKRADTMTLNQALASFQDVMNEIVRVAWEIAGGAYVPKFGMYAAIRET